MRIAYIAPYKGPTLVKRRPVVRNLSLSNTIKIELIAALLHSQSHEVEIISQGEVIENACRLYPSFSEPERFHSGIPVYYASALPIRRLNALWSSLRTLQLFRTRHRVAPYDLVIIWNLKEPQITCANYAIRHLEIPVILEYEDDQFADRSGHPIGGALLTRRTRACGQLFTAVSGCIGVSPHLLSQLPNRIPKILLRGVVGDDMVKAGERSKASKRNWVLFSGTHVESNGVAQLIHAWPAVGALDWELHITGHGDMTHALQMMAEKVQGITFHGLLGREKLVDLISSAKLCINPHAVSETPGNLFAFKIIEYLAGGAHVITTPMGTLEREVETGITYMPDNNPVTIAGTLRRVIQDRSWERCAMQYVVDTYGPFAVAKSLQTLIGQVTREPANNH